MAERSRLFEGLSPLTASEQEQLAAALVSGYDKESLVMRVGFRMGVQLGDEIELTGGSRPVFTRILTWMTQQGLDRDLLALAWSGKRDNPLLKAAAQAMLPDPAQALALYEARQLPPAPASREAMVSTRSKILDFEKFVQEFGDLRTGICRVEGAKMGKGFLIGRNTILTNYHVVEGAIKRSPLAEALISRFDFHGGGPGTPAGLAIDDPIRLGSPYSASDLSGSGEPAPDQLDFAVLRPAVPVYAEQLTRQLASSLITDGGLMPKCSVRPNATRKDAARVIEAWVDLDRLKFRPKPETPEASRTYYPPPAGMTDTSPVKAAAR